MSSDSKASKTGGKQGTRAPSGPQGRTRRDTRTGRTRKDSARTQEDAGGQRQRLLTLPPLYSTVQCSTVPYSRRTDTLLTLPPSSPNLPRTLKTFHLSGLNLITRLKSTRTLVPTSRATEARPRPDPTRDPAEEGALEPSGTRRTRPVQQKHGTHVPTPGHR